MSRAEFQQSELWEISRQLISFNTVSALSNLNIAEFLANYLESSGMSVQIVTDTIAGVPKANVVAWVGPAEPGGLILSGHMDIVPFEGQPGWKTDPLKMQTDGKRIFGRGVSDMKIFLAQSLLAARQQPLHQLKRPLVCIFTCDEEVAGQGSARLVQTLPEVMKACPLPEIALIGEPTNFAIFPAHKGYASFDLRVQGKGGHSSLPSNGLNAIDIMGQILQVIKQVGKQLEKQSLPENIQLFPEVPYSTFNNGLISGGLAPNMIAETCRLTASLRVAPGDTADEILQQVQQQIEQKILPEVRLQAPDGGIFLENLVAVPPLKSPLEGPFVELLGRIIGQSITRGAPYATDGGQFQSLGINSYICGPGELAEAHQPNESLAVENFFGGLEKLERIIHAWCIE